MSDAASGPAATWRAGSEGGRRSLLTSLLLSAQLACGSPSAPGGPARSPAVASPVVESSARAPSGAATVSRSVRARFALGAGEGVAAVAALGVELELRGPVADLGELELASAAHGELAGLELADDAGGVSVTTSRDGEALRVQLVRPARGALRVRYRIESTVATFDDAVASTIGPDRFRLSGETALLLPLAFDRQPFSLQLDFDLSPLPRGSAVASTLGADFSERTFTGAELRHASFLGGPLQTARFVTRDGTDEWFWLEELGFDARPVSGEAAALRAELARYFESRAPSPYVVLASASVRLDGSFTAAARSGGLLLELPIGASWTGATRITVAREFFRPWFGGELRLVASAGKPTESELWFNEGVARALARELLFRFAMLGSDEYAAEINGIIAAAVLSPFSGQPALQVSERATRDVLARRHLAARGVLYMTSLDVRARGARGGAPLLDALVGELFARARAEHRPFELAGWFAAAAQYAGAAAESDYRRIIEAGQVPAFIPSGLGPCFQLARRRYAEFELGFDLEKSRARAGGIAGLAARGPAARAGLRATDRLRSARYVEGDARVPAVLELERAGRELTIQFEPSGRAVEGPAWVRRSDVPEAACQRH